MLSGDREVSAGLGYRVIENFPNVNKSWLLHGEGDMFLTAIQNSDVVADTQAEYGRLGATELQRIIAEQGAEIRRLKEDVERERAERLRLLGVVEALTKRN